MTNIKTEFENKLNELGFSYMSNTDGYYIIYENIDTDCIVYTHLILSDLIDIAIHGSRNDNKIQGIGNFKLKIPPDNIHPEFFILGFQNIGKNSNEFIIIPTKELKSRLIESDHKTTDNQEMEIVFWLMVDDYNGKYLYECTKVGIEFEWYYLSKGKDGRMIDKTARNYSEYLNNWNRLKTS